MKTLLLIFAMAGGMFGVGFAATLTAENYHDWEAAWQTFLCVYLEKGDGSLLEELKACMKLQSKEIAVIMGVCLADAYPQSTDPIKFVEAACGDPAVFERYNSCIKPHAEGESFERKLEENEEAFKCYVAAMSKHGFSLE